jgi:hypothetical protein
MMMTIEMADGKSLRTGSMIVNDWDGNDGEWKKDGEQEKSRRIENSTITGQ